MRFPNVSLSTSCDGVAEFVLDMGRQAAIFELAILNAERLHNYLVQIGFQRKNDNSSPYIKKESNKKIVLAKKMTYSKKFQKK